MELRFRQLTLASVKALCHLFRQMNMKVYVDQKIKHLQNLIDFQLEMSDSAELIYTIWSELLDNRVLLLLFTKKNQINS